MRTKGLFMVLIVAIFVIAMLTACADQPEEPVPSDPAVLCNDIFSIKVPNDWIEKMYAVITEDEIKIYQKAAYEKFGGGWICSVRLYEDTTYEILPAHEVVVHLWKENSQTNKRADWYLVAEYPSDVQADVENEESMKEYFEMFEQASRVIKETIQFLTEPSDPS